MKGNYKTYVEHANTKDIHTISNCCFNLLEDNIPLPLSKKNVITMVLTPIQKELSTLGKKKASVKKKRRCCCWGISIYKSKCCGRGKSIIGLSVAVEVNLL